MSMFVNQSVLGYTGNRKNYLLEITEWCAGKLLLKDHELAAFPYAQNVGPSLVICKNRSVCCHGCPSDCRRTD